MKLKNLTFLFILISSYAFSQKLGFSSLSPYGGSNSTNNHTLLYNSGEVLDNQIDLTELAVSNGLLQGIAQNGIPNSFIQVQFFYDNNEDGIKDSDDPYINLGSFNVEGFGDYINYSRAGITLSAPENSYNISYNDIGTEGWKLTTPPTQTLDINSQQQFGLVEFGMAPEEIFSKVEPYLASGNFRCSSPLDYQLTVVNNGFTVKKHIVWLKMDARIPNVVYSIPPDEVIDSNYVGWNIELFPTESTVINFSIRVPGIADGFMVGDLFKSIAWIDQDPEIIEFCYEQELRCAYDPNDKLVNPNRPDSLGLLNQPIIYTLRFQNTGNDYAEDVVVTDTISEHLDLSTFKIINTSHPNELEVQNDKDNSRIINFRFDNIYLPDSNENLEGSNGHIMYTIKPNAGLPIGTVINNTGYIYFDFNPAVVTNTTHTSLVDKYPIVNTESVNVVASNKVFPNPSFGKIQFEKQAAQVCIKDMQGRIIKQFRDTKELDLSGYAEGTYLLEIQTDGLKSIEKVVLIK